MKFTKGKRITLPALPEMGIKKPQRAVVISPPKNGVMMCEVDRRDRQRSDRDGLVEVQVENGKIVFDPAMPPCDESDLVEIPERPTPHRKTSVIQVYCPGRGNSRTVGYVGDLHMSQRGCITFLAITREKRAAIQFVDEAWRKKVIRGMLAFNVYGA